MGHKIIMPIDVTNIVEPARNALAPVGASLSDAWSAVIGDRIAAWRLKNAAELQVAVNAAVSKLGLKLDRSKIPERYAFAWFEEATKQDEPEIQELFARLLARAAAGDGDAADRRHMQILTHLTPMDARVMEWFIGDAAQFRIYPIIRECEVMTQVMDKFGGAAADSIEHLLALGVFQRLWAIDPRRPREERPFVELDLTATSRGLSLYRACAPVSPPEAGGTR